MLQSKSLFLNNNALLPPTNFDQPSKLLVAHTRNEEVFVPKDDNLQAWKKEFIIPWGPLFDLFIVLLYIFFALTYQSSKVRFYLNYQTIFDDYFLPEEDEESPYIYTKEDLIDSANSTAYHFFNFASDFPSQDIFKEDSPLTVTIETTEYEDELIIIRDEVDTVASNFTNISNILISATFEMDYLIVKFTEQEIYKTSLTYSVYFDQVKQLNLYEMSSDLVGKSTVENGSFMSPNQLVVSIFPITLAIIDSIAIVLTLSRFVSFFHHAREYAQKNYITLYQALLWKMDRFETFNLSYQLLTLISITLYLRYANDDLGRHRFILFMVAFSGLLHCCGLFGHLRLKKETWFTARFIFLSLSRTLRFVFGFLPFIVAWAFMGLALFGYFSELFDGFVRSLKIMFSLMHTDVCMDTQDQLNEHAAAPNWLIVVFVCSWLCLTGGMVINILIAIVENTLEDMLSEEGF